MTNKTAFITGITGQDGAMLAQILLEKDTAFAVCAPIFPWTIHSGLIVFRAI